MKLESVFGFELHLGKFGTYFVKTHPLDFRLNSELPSQNVLNLLGRGAALRFWVNETLNGMDAQDTVEGKMKVFKTYEEKLRIVNSELLTWPDQETDTKGRETD